jgi:hypothetical protein
MVSMGPNGKAVRRLVVGRDDIMKYASKVM